MSIGRTRPSAIACFSALARHVRGDHSHAEGKPILAGDVANDFERLLEVRSGTRRTRRTDDQWNIQPARRAQHLAQVALGPDTRRRHLAAAEVGWPDVDRAHIDADHIGRMCQTRLEGRRRNAVAELARGTERAQRPSAAAEIIKQARNGGHSSISRRAACCWAP